MGLTELQKRTIRIFIINLKKSEDRKNHIKKQLESLNLDYEFVEAIDGHELSENEIKSHRKVKYPPWPSFNARYLTKGEIGCILSHLKIYSRMIEENIGCACILEDDCIIGENIKIMLERLQVVELDYELLLLGHSGLYQDTSRGAEYSRKKENVLSNYYIAKPIECPFGTYAYLIKQSAARILLQHCYPLRIPMDYMTGHARAIGVNVYILTPPIVRHDKALFPSTIYDSAQVKSLFVYRIRGIKLFLGDKFPILRKMQTICKFTYLVFCLKLRKSCILDENSYIKMKYFPEQTLRISSPDIQKQEVCGHFKHDRI